MNDLIIKLRQQLTSMIEEIDNYKIESIDTIIIKKADFKSIKKIGEISSSAHVFEYLNGVKFILLDYKKSPYNWETYNKFMNGTLEVLILNMRDKIFNTKGYSINYELEDENKTFRRNFKLPIEEGNNKL